MKLDDLLGSIKSDLVRVFSIKDESHLFEFIQNMYKQAILSNENVEVKSIVLFSIIEELVEIYMNKQKFLLLCCSPIEIVKHLNINNKSMDKINSF